MNRYDFIPAGVAVVVALAFLFIFLNNKSLGNEVIVYVDNESVGSYNLKTEQQIYIPSGNTRSGLTLDIRDGYAMVIESDCKNQICVNTPKISKNGESIVCLPQKIVITVINNNEQNYDGFTN